MSDLGREKPFDPRDRLGAGDAGRLIEEEGAYWGAFGYLAPPRSRRPARTSSSSSFASWGRTPSLV